MNELPTRKESNREHFLPGRYPGFHNDYPPDYQAYERLWKDYGARRNRFCGRQDRGENEEMAENGVAKRIRILLKADC